MKRLILLILITAASSVLPAQAKILKGYSAAGLEPFGVTVDSIDYRTSLTRVYCKIVARPHTSGRIDRMTLAVNGRSYVATDIDGVDFNRYFQWEDDGVIPLEVDFPAMKPAKTMKLEIVTPKGNGTFTIKKK